MGICGLTEKVRFNQIIFYFDYRVQESNFLWNGEMELERLY